MPSSDIQASAHPPAQPSYILRGHAAQIHAVRFLRQNLRLLTGDADGWVVLWSLPIKRPVAVWKPHAGTVLGIESWGDGRVVTHGRDGKLHIWQLREEDEAEMSKTLPIDDAVSERKQPWLLHTLVVSAINFCSFASLPMSPPDEGEGGGLLVATPGVQDGSVNVTSFPAESRIATIPAPRGTNTGMLMAIGLYHDHGKDGKPTLTVIGGYESGHAAVFQQNATRHWECLYIHKAHAQPVLSIAMLVPPPPAESSSKMTTGTSSFFTSAADAIIARHPLPSPASPRPDAADAQTLQTRHAGQQSLVLRSDHLIFATAGWDGRMRVYSAKTMKELAVLKWHKEGCYAVAFADILDGDGGGEYTDQGRGNNGTEVAKRQMTVAEKRLQKAQDTHWLAAGSKDGKVSLWEVY